MSTLAGKYVFPASFAQRRLWVLDALEPESAAANIEHRALRLRGQLDTGALSHALDTIVARHEALRTALAGVDGEPMQVIEPSLTISLPVVDLTGRPGGLASEIAARTGEPMPLETAPLLRCTLLRLASDDHLLLTSFHHAVYDQWSGAVFLRELLACYRAAVTGGDPGLAELPLQYADFAAWQRDWLDSEEEERQVSYWRRQLADLPALGLPTDRPRPRLQTFRGAVVTSDLPPELMSALENTARQHRASAFMAALAAFAVLLRNYSGQTDIAVGSPVAGRVRPELEPLIGCFINNLVLRADLSGDPAVADLLARVRRTCLDAYTHAEVPFERLVEQLRPERDLSRNPLFSVMFVFAGAPIERQQVCGLDVTPERIDAGTAKFDLFVSVLPTSAGASLSIEYNTGLFDAATVTRMLGHYRALLEDLACGDPARPVSALRMLTGDEEKQLAAWGHGERRDIPALAYPAAPPGSGSRTAVVCGEQSLTYGELDQRAGEVAAWLAAEGITPGSRAGLLLDRRVDLPAIIIGTWRAGAAYVPLDAAWPDSRISYVIGDCGATAVITTAELAGRVPSTCRALITGPGTQAPAGEVLPAAAPDPDAEAYVMYTSGSTGRPKGVAVGHRQVANFLTAMASELALPGSTVFAAVTTLTFDISVLELLLPLLTGACTGIVDRGTAADGRLLADHLAAHHVTAMQATPATWALLREAGWAPAAPGFTALAGGERVPADLASWLVGTGASGWHVYGPTETTVWSTICPMSAAGQALPLGHPVANTELMVMDQDERRVPVGVTGELWIGGAGVAHGYVGQPELTAERFVTWGGQRYYRTGDKVRWRAGGVLEFVGRADFQVKVRGFRVEPGEVEAVLRGQPGVSDAAVAAQGEGASARLVGYVTPAAPGEQLDTARVLAGARGVLPDYMVPARLVILERFPRTSNGKLDRAALPEPDGSRPDAARYVPPRTLAERQLAEIWAQVLGLDRVGADDNFFDLGGHSLLAAKVLAAVRSRWDIDITLRTLFAQPTVAGFAAALPTAAAGAGLAHEHAQPVTPLPRAAQASGPHAGRYLMPASFGQRRLWFLHQLDPASGLPYVITGGLRLRGPLDEPALRRALGTVVARHEALRTGLAQVDGKLMQVISPQLDFEPAVTDVSAATSPDGALSRLAATELTRPFDLAGPSLLRALLARLGAGDHALLIAAHHAVSDRLSMEVIAAELAHCYRAYTQGQQPGLAPVAVQYADFASWQLTGVGQDTQGRDLEYWRDQLAGLPTLDLPTDHPRPASQSYQGETRSITIGSGIARGCSDLAAATGVTMFMIGMAAFILTLSRYSGQEDFGVGTPVAGRSRPELEPTVGFFANNLVLRADLSGDPAVAELLERVRQTSLAAFSHASVPFERLVEDLRPPRDLARPPLFSVMFVYNHAPTPVPDLPGLAVTPLRAPTAAARYDLTLTLFPDEDGDGYRVTAEYSTALFGPGTIDRMLAHYRMLLAEFARDSTRRLSGLAALPEAERDLVLGEWAKTSPQPSGVLHELFAAQAAKTPAAPAAVCGGSTLTYAELGERAGRLAAVLAGRGAGHGDRVAICAERGPGLLAAILAVLKTGAAYVPLDPRWPAERMRYVIEDSDACLLVSDVPAAGGVAGCPVVRPDATGTGPVPAPGCSPDSLAYVIYTSGSTGEPKGTLISHGSVARLVSGLAGRLDLTPADVWSMTHSAAFDVSVCEMWGAWLTGARVVVVPYLTSREPGELAGLLDRAEVTVLSQTPTAFGQLARAEAERDTRLAKLRYVLFAGEKLDVAMLAGWLGRYRDSRPVLVNLYGITEITVHLTVHRVRAAELGAPSRSVVGRPLPDMAVYLLRWRDGRAQPVPAGAAGEICVAGPGVAAGYLGRPDLTAQRFAQFAGRRVYRSGDLARWLPDGDLEFLGRADDQVKIRGFRVEPGETEAVLRSDPRVSEAAVIARPAGRGDLALAAYVVPAAGQRPSPGELLETLRQRLPDYLVPQHLMLLDQLPLTGNGKLDKAALPQPGGARLDVAGYVPPRTPAEQQLARIWAAVLGVERVGAEDNFFHLGGHSLLATDLLAQVREQCGVAVPLRVLFGAPTVAGLARALPELSGGSPAELPAVTARSRAPASSGPFAGRVVFPASFGQRRVWFLQQLDPASAAAYVLAGGYLLRGELDVAALRQALDTLAARHESLRTGLDSLDGEPVQVVWPQATIPLDVTEAGEDALAEWVRAAIAQPFTLATPPLVRAHLAALGDGSHALLVTLHHAVGDRLSVEIFVRELAECYAAHAAGRQPQLPEMPAQFGDFAAWQRDWLDSDAAGEQVRYWRGQLGALPGLDLPTDRPRPAAQTYRGGLRTAALPAPLAAGLEQLAASSDATLFMVLLAGYAITLGHYTGQQDIPVGSPVSGRPLPELAPLIGYLTNNLVLRTDLSGGPSFTALLRRVKRMCLDAYAHAEVPFEQLVEQLRPQRDLSRSPLFSTMFVHTHLPSPVPVMPGLDVTPLPLPAGSAKFDLTMALAPTGDGSGSYQVIAEYNSDLFCAGTIDRIVSHYLMVLDAVAASPDTELARLPELPAAERELLTRWGTGPSLDIPATTVPGLLSPAFTRFADRTAVSDGEQSLSYAELDARASQLAHHLRGLGAGPGTLVALLCERSAGLQVALLGVLRAGAAYVPVDTQFPADRIGYILRDSAAQVVLTQQSLAGRLPRTGATVLCLDTGWAEVAAQSTTPPAVTAGPQDLAYVIYTSGSTGRPKGTALPHRAVVNFLLTMSSEPGMSRDAVVGAVSNISCDMPVLDLYLPLLAGARIEMISRDDVLDGERLAARLRSAGVNFLQATPATWGLLCEAGWLPPGPGFTALMGAERVPAGLASWLAGAGVTVWHMYGPTETTVWSTVYQVAGDESVLPLGHPVANTELAVLDAGGRRVPAGVAGELWIGGAGVAQGYLGREELTAERFPVRGGARFYRTGDVVRWRPGGVLEFMGRADFQVKVRGYRVELGEVEAALRASPQVGDAVVVARGEGPQLRLVGYATPATPGSEVDAGQVLAGARGVLPDYMVPARLIILGRFPMTLNGNKIDRSALPEPGGDRPDAATYVPPRTPAERQLAEIWAQVLRVERIGADDNFFGLGGHSLLATRMINRVRAAFGVDISVRAVFERPVLHDLAEVLPMAAEPLTAPIPAQARMKLPDGRFAGRYLLPASFGQRRLWFLQQLDPASAAAYIIGGPVRLSGPLDHGLLQRAVNTVVARHETLRTAFGAVDGEPVQVVSPSLTVPVAVHDLRGAPDGDLGALVKQVLTTPFDLAEPPLLRLVLAVLGDGDHVLVTAFHHAIGDEGSTAVFVRELAACYRAYTSGGEPGLAALPLQYGDFAAWQDSYLSSPGAASDLAYWRKQLTGLPVLDLPTDRPRPPVQSYHGARQQTGIPAGAAAAVTGLARDQGATLFMVGLAAFMTLLWRHCGQEDFGVGTPVAGRSRPELEPLIGFFVNNLVLRADLSGDPTVAELLGRVRQASLDAFAHADVPFERLVEELRPPRDLSRTPLVQAGFLLAEAVSRAEHSGTGLTVTQQDYDPGTSKVDLAMSLVPREDGLQVMAEFNTDLFAPATIGRMLEHYRMLLFEFAAGPQRRLSELPSLPPAELAQLETWGAGPVAALPAGCFPDLFEEQAAAHPGRAAVVHGGSEISYSVLNENASRLAHRLLELGSGPDDLVAIVAGRSISMVTAVLAVLKAGAAYLPVDPSYPPERIAFMLTDSGCRVVLATAGLADTLPVTPAQVVRVDEDWPAISRYPATNPQRQTGHGNLAYAIYTSGSTGTPKGVLVTHRSLVNLHLTRELGGFHEGSRFLQFAPFSFDVSVWELTMALLGGHVLVIPEAADLAGPAEIAALIGRQQVTVTFLPPSLLAYLQPEDLPTIELLGSGGEDCPADVAQRWAGRVKFLIGYGPTETTVYATVTHNITGGGHPPIGWPVHNTHVMVTGRDRRPVPIGAPGELLIGGAGLARGYLGRPELTSERFIVHQQSGERMYATGDLVRYLPDGNLEFLGRLDDQVKIRGFRIELGEVEAVLRAHPGVAAATVAVAELASGEPALAGYVVPSGSAPAGLGAAVREFAATRLPRYMLPATVTEIGQIPLGPSGKVDRAALPAPAATAGGAATAAPRTPTEQRLAELFASLLGVAEVGVDDSFFDLGGHSLLAARLVAAIAAAFGVDLPVRELFYQPTVAGVAAQIDAARPAAPSLDAELRRDISLDPGIRAGTPVEWPRHPADILVIGATGFIGGHLVRNLLDSTGATIHCLVRARDGEHAARRLRDSFPGADAARLRPICGDLAAPSFGLSGERFTELAGLADEIYHCAAELSAVLPYEQVREINVGGLSTMLRLACMRRTVPVHYVSTLAVFARVTPAEPVPDVLTEDTLPPRPPTLGSGYEKSKWVAEHIIELARQRGVPVTVYRPGRVAGDSRTGAWRGSDPLAQIIMACASLGMVPDEGMATEIIPVDVLAEMIARLARDPASAGVTFHCTTGRKVSFALLADALSAEGYPVRRAGVAEWRDVLRRRASSSESEVVPAVHMLMRGAAEGGWREPRIDIANTKRVLAGSMTIPEIGPRLLGRYLTTLLKEGMTCA